MNTKLKILTFLLFAFPMLLFSQIDNFICGTIDDPTPDPEGAYSYSTDEDALTSYEPVVFNIFFWGINQDDGTSQNKLTVNDALKAVAQLNILYNSNNIFFKYRGFDFIDSSRFYTVYKPGDPNDEGENSSYNSLVSFARSNNYQFYKTDAMNVYIPKSTVGFAGVSTGWRINIVNSYSLESDTGRVINHEMGHTLGLGHTQYQWRRSGSQEDYENCEHVTRNINDPNYNADYAGDRVHDTAAVPEFSTEHYYELIDEGFSEEYAGANYIPYKYINAEFCTYFNENGKDCLETPFDIEEKDVRNLMAYTTGNCGLDLTTGQKIRIRERLISHASMYTPYMTDVPSLYEPYTGEYFVVGPTPDHKPLFQPGFEYHFVACEGDFPAPAPYGTIFPYNSNTILLHIANDETDFSSIIHPNHSAILIKNEVVGEASFPYAKKCYNNFNRAPSGGVLLKFNDNVLNANITITPQDSTSINNPNLIQNLENGLYKIEKNYNDGSTQETIIIKENNE